MSAKISHGRGGAANIRPDDTPYADGEITREGPIGDQGEGAYSSGRGGAGNIGKDHEPGQQVGDEDVIPETATREAKYENFHTGRGGAGNEVHAKPKEKTSDLHGVEKAAPQESFKDKVKDVFHKH